MNNKQMNWNYVFTLKRVGHLNYGYRVVIKSCDFIDKNDIEGQEQLLKFNGYNLANFSDFKLSYIDPIGE